MIRADVADLRSGRAYEKYGWMILSANAILGIFAAVLTNAPSLLRALGPHFDTAYPIMGALGTALVGFNVFALVMALIPYRRYERWAWYTLWMLPLQWLLQFAFLPRFHLFGTCHAHHSRLDSSLQKVLPRQAESARVR